MSDVKQTVGFLQRVPLFRGLKTRQLEHIAKRFVEREFAAGQAVVTQGQGGEGFFVIVSGKAEVIRERSDGTKAVVNTFGPTDFFGELALLDDAPRMAQVRAAEDCTLAVFFREDFLGLLQTHAGIASKISLQLARHIGQRLREAVHRYTV